MDEANSSKSDRQADPAWTTETERLLQDWRNRTYAAQTGHYFMTERLRRLNYLLGVPVIRPKVTETTALGAAYLAGLAVGYWKDQKQIAAQWQVDRRFTPAMQPAQRKQLEAGWRKALDRARRWEEAG